VSGHDPKNDDVQRRLAPRVVTSGHLLRLEQVSRDHQFSQNLDPQWLETVIPDGGHHVITPALTIPGRTHLPAEEDHLRSLVRIQLSDDLPWTDAPAMLSWLDLPFDVFEALPEPTTGVMNWIADLTTQGVPSMAQVAQQQVLANERSVANAPATFPIWGTITWFTPEQGGRHGGPPLTPWETYYRATALVAPSRLEDGLASVIVDVSNRNLWQSNAKLRWLAEPIRPWVRAHASSSPKAPRRWRSSPWSMSTTKARSTRRPCPSRLWPRSPAASVRQQPAPGDP